MTTVMILGGDGFCGWPTALHLSKCGYDVVIIDDFSRRRIDLELGTNTLVPIVPIDARINTWGKITGLTIQYEGINVAENYAVLTIALRKHTPDVIVHFAEQRAAPYSMKSSRHKRYTVNNNIMATHNVLCAVTEKGLNAHIIHLGTMGVYGYNGANITIPEGYITAYLKDPITDNLVETDIYYPADPGSIYHMTKCMDTQLFYYYNKNDHLRITDLHQGVVWGTCTEQTEMHPYLANRFDYDGDYGTVVNRFIVQAAKGHPLTVYGTGEQTRAFIHLQNMVQCIELAIENPPTDTSRVRVWNQTTEQRNVLSIAKEVSKLTGADIRFYKNPRNEKKQNELSACMDNIQTLGLSPITICEDELKKIYTQAYQYKDKIDLSVIPCTSTWSSDRVIDLEGRYYEGA